jgi:competence protein ComFC
MPGGTPSAVKDWFNAALAFLYPPVCQICRQERATPEQGYVCGSCWSGKGGVRFIKPPFCGVCGLPVEGEITTAFQCANCQDLELHFRTARAAVVTTPLLLEVIHRYKYSRALYFEPFLADLLVQAAVPALAEERWDFIVPVPLYPVKEREREFNQAANLGYHLSRATGIPMNKKLVRRVQPTRTQTQLTRVERAANVRNAFAPYGDEKMNGAKIVLLDDVLTTGATTSACARQLIEAGASEVCVWTVARGL